MIRTGGGRGGTESGVDWLWNKIHLSKLFFLKLSPPVLNCLFMPYYLLLLHGGLSVMFLLPLPIPIRVFVAWLYQLTQFVSFASPAMFHFPCSPACNFLPIYPMLLQMRLSAMFCHSFAHICVCHHVAGGAASYGLYFVQASKPGNLVRLSSMTFLTPVSAASSVIYFGVQT